VLSRLLGRLWLSRVLALSILLTTIAPSFVFAAPACKVIFDESQIPSPIESGIEVVESLKNLWEFDYVMDGQIAGSLQAHRSFDGFVEIQWIEVANSIQGHGISTALLNLLLEKAGKESVFKTLLALDNSKAFRDSYDEISNPRLPTFRAELSVKERWLEAVYKTPAYKSRKKIGIGRVVRLDVTGCDGPFCNDDAEIVLFVTGE
jgi:GNAT superfamily N-acetyltransferase